MTLRSSPRFKRIFNRVDLIALLVLLIGANLFAIYYVRQEHCIYFHDTINYWLRFDFVGDSFKHHPFQAVIRLVSSIRREDYNNLPAFFLLPFYFALGSNRIPFILAIVNTFFFPAAVSLMFLYKDFMQRADFGWPAWAPFLCAFAVGSSPLFVSPVLIGYVDVGGVFITNCVLLIYFSRPFSEQKRVHLAAMGLLLALAVLFRRWYSYWSLSFYIVVALDMIRLSFDGPRLQLEHFKRSVAKFTFMGVVSAAFLLTIAWPIFFRMITTDYSYLYSYMRSSGNLFQSFQNFCRQFGPFHCALFFAGFLYACVNARTRTWALFLGTQWVMMFILFSRTQDFETHQFYLLEPTMLVFQLLLVSVVLKIAKSRIRQVSYALVYGLTAAVIFLNVFVPDLPGYLKCFKPLLPKQTHYPVRRDDFEQLEKLLNRMQFLLKDPADRVYVLPSADTMNSQILTNAYLSMHRKKTFESQIYWGHSVDKRDRFPKGLLSARYVIVCDPVRYFERATDSLVVGIPVDLISKGKGIGASYKKLPDTFLLDKDVKVAIYEKIMPFNSSDIESLADIFKKRYPEWGDSWIVD